MNIFSSVCVYINKYSLFSDTVSISGYIVLNDFVITGNDVVVPKCQNLKHNSRIYW